MNLTRERLFFLWSGIGPLLALITLLLMLFHTTPVATLFALTMVLGLPLCFYQKKWGIGISILALTILLWLNTEALVAAPVWHLGIAFSIALTLFITSNSFEEAASLVEEFTGQSAAIQKTLAQYKSEIEELKFKHQNELSANQKTLDSFSEELKNTQAKSQLLHDELEQKRRELRIAENEFEKARNANEVFRRELDAKTIKEEHVLEELLEKRREVFQLREQLQEAQEEQKNQAKTIQDEAEAQNLRDEISKKDQDLFNIQFRLDSALEDIQHQGKELSKIQNEKILQEKFQQELSHQIESLMREKEHQELTINKLQHETSQGLSLKVEKEKLEDSLKATLQELEKVRFEALKMEEKKVEEKVSQECSKCSDQNLTQEQCLRKRAEGSYLQLKEQFSEKSAVLDETRRQLFHTQEKLLQLQRNIKEQEQFVFDPQVQSLLLHIRKMQNHLDRSENSYLAEINILHDIITQLS